MGVNIGSFGRHMRADNLSGQTFVSDSGAARQFYQYVIDQGMLFDMPGIKRERVEAFITDLLRHWNPAIADNRYRGLRSSFKWAVSG